MALLQPDPSFGTSWATMQISSCGCRTSNPRPDDGCSNPPSRHRLACPPRRPFQRSVPADSGGGRGRGGGKVVDGGAGNFDFSRMRWDRFPFGRALTFAPFFGAAAGLIAFMSTLARVVVLCVLPSLVLLVGRGYVERVGARAIAEPVKAGAIGLLAQLLFIPLLFVTVLLLIVTIIGIPLLVLVPFAILALAVVGLVGFTAITYSLGRFASERLSWNIENPYLVAVTGIVVLLSPVLIARLLGLAEWMLFPITGALAFCGF